MPSHQAHWNVQTDRRQPVPRVLIISDCRFLGLALARELVLQGAQIFYFNNKEGWHKKEKRESLGQNFETVGKNLIKSFDYLFQINSGALTKQIYSTQKLLDLTVDAGAKFLCATINRQTLTRAHLCSLDRARKINWRLVHFNYIWGKGAEKDSLLGLLTADASFGRLVIAGTGEEKIYPLYIDDFIQGLLRAMFLKDSFQKLYLLSGTQPVKLLDFSWSLKNAAGKDLQIDYVPTPEEITWSIDHFAFEKIKNSWWYLGIYPKKNIENIKLFFESLKPANKQKKFTALPSILPKITLPRINKILVNFGLVFVCLLILASPYLVCLGFGLRGAHKLKLIFEKLKNKQLENLSPLGRSAQGDLAFSQNILYKLAKVNNLVGLGSATEEVNKLLNLGLGISASVENLENSFTYAKNLEEIIFAKSANDPQTELSGLQLSLNQLAERLAFCQTQIDDLGKTNLPWGDTLNQNLNSAKELMPKARKEILQTRQLLSLMPAFLSFGGKKSYLVLLQNNMELRPTGGFIGSYAILTFESGRLLDFFVEDVWNADGQLQGHVTPPPDLGVLGETDWYLRDSNWSPDFPTSAVKAEWFLEKETGQATDGVIGINLNVVKSILGQIGPVQVPGFDETITADNLFERAEYQAEVNFFPGSTQKKSFLSSLSVLLFEKIKELPPDKVFRLLQVIQENLNQKDMFLYFNNQDLNSKIQDFGWNGEIKNVSLGRTANFSGPGLADYLMVVDSNVGVNKANFFLTRAIELDETILADGRLINQLKLTYKNSSPSQAWPGGSYKNYLRLLLPKDVDKISVREGINGQFKPLIEKIRTSVAFDKNIFGFLTNVPAGETREFIITYQRGQILPVGGSVFDLAIFLQKQSGTQPDPITLKINFPEKLKPAKIMPQGLWKPQSVTFSDKFDKDKLFAVEFSR